ncbi:DUF4880 domain-containing protein, partial [Variovorax paradoxus]|uniref:FecR/PupR family sigma factor regulator n=1 Tax=Variovorax paradoxus TaxID=34073 RepID=UPI001ABD3CB9
MTSTPSPEDASRLREEVLDWFVRRQREGWSASEEREFQGWLVADPHRAEAWRA